MRSSDFSCQMDTSQTNMGYLKHNNDFIFVININESAGKGKFALELGVNPSHCTIFPGNDREVSCVEDCFYRDRLGLSDDADFWWKNSVKPDTILKDLIQIKRNTLDNLYDYFLKYENTVNDEVVEHFLNGVAVWPYEGMATAKAALYMAGVLNFLGKKESSSRVAKYGLDNAGLAVSLKRDLRKFTV